MAEDDPVTCAKCTKDSDLLELPGSKRLKRLAKREKKFVKMLRQAFKAKQKNAMKYKFGIRIPRTFQEAKELDKENGNALWQDVLTKEMDQIKAYTTFTDLGKGTRIPKGHQKIDVQIVWDCKFDLKRKAWLVASVNLTPPSSDNAFSGVVSLEGVRTVMFLSELNGLQLCACDIGNSYLEAKTREKLCIIAGPEFGELEGRTLAMLKACYGVRTSGNHFVEKLADDLRGMGFFQSQVDSAIWMYNCGDHYEHLCAWVDDILFASKNHMLLMEELKNKHKHVLKGVGSHKYYLGSDIKRVGKDIHDKGILTIGCTTYVKKCLQNYEGLLGFKPPKKTSSPMEVKYSPESVTTDELDDQGRQIYL